MRRSAIFFVLACAACSSNENEGPTSLPHAPVDILVDSMGVPHVYASDDDDAMFGAGYQMAVDRLYQMEMLRRFAYGRLAEILGDAGFDRDRQARTFDFARWGRADAELEKTVDPERARLLVAWVAGINARVDEIRSGAAPRPFGFRPEEHDFLPERWADVDPYVVLKGAGFALDRTIDFEIAISLVSAVYPGPIAAVNLLEPAHPVYAVPPEDRPAGAKTKRPPRPAAGASPPIDAAAAFHAMEHFAKSMPRASGSNSWAIDGRFTATNKPLIANDPHLSFDFFGAPYPMHINSADKGGSYDVEGFAYPGTPGIALGHNRKLMWTATSAFADVTDVWQVTRDGDGIKIGETTVPVTTRDEAITVREAGKAAGEGHVETVSYEDVEGYGVILPNELIPFPVGGPYLVGWTGFTARPARWFMELDRASSLDEFEAAADRMREMDYSLLAADASGIALRVGVDVPDRPDVSGGRAPFEVMSGDDAKSFWTGSMLPRDELPRSRAKERGWIATANNDPFGFTDDGAIDDDPWYYGAFFDPGYRASRIESEIDRLTKAGGVKLEDVEALQTDVRSTLADDLAPALLAAHDEIATDPALAAFAGDADLDAVVDLLTSAWDREMKRDSAGAFAFNAYLHVLAAEVMKDDIPLAFDFAMNLEAVFVIKLCAMGVLGRYPDASKFVQGGPESVMLSAAKKTAALIKARTGTLDPRSYRYADVKVTRFDDAFGYGVPLFDRPSDGGEDTIRVSQNISFPDSGPWVTSYVSVERSIGTFDDDGTPEAFVAFPVGATADPESKETEAALEDYLEGRYRKLLFQRSEIEPEVVRRTRLDPAP